MARAGSGGIHGGVVGRGGGDLGFCEVARVWEEASAGEEEDDGDAEEAERSATGRSGAESSGATRSDEVENGKPAAHAH